jgi:predicted membrane-bound spermidine synthase
MSFAAAALVACLCGFTALSYEMLWFRVYSFTTGGSASAFGVMLGAYLMGIALGSLAVRHWCDERAAAGDAARLRIPAVLIVIASLAGFALTPFVAFLVRHASYAWSLPAVAVAAGLMGAVLPLVAHFGIRPDDRAGQRLSWLYLANIVGSASGSLLTGFVLMQHLTLGRIALLLLLLGLAMGAVLLVGVKWPVRLAGFAVLAAGAAVGEPRVHDSLWEKLLYKAQWNEGARFAENVENRSGVVSVTPTGRVFGGGMYDGYFNLDLSDNRNGISRAFALAAYRPSYREVLMVGLSSGSWAKVIATLPGVERLTVVEINPGYLDLIAKRPEVASVLTDPKVNIVIDDGRRWMVANPGRKFDLVVQNTTWHWRGHITNLLSVEYMDLVRSHLNEGGVYYFNTTGSANAEKTACSMFENGLRFQTFMAVSDRDVQLDRDRWRDLLEWWRIDGDLVLDLRNASAAARLKELVNSGVEPCAAVLRRTRDVELITDDNMVNEWTRSWKEMPSESP